MAATAMKQNSQSMDHAASAWISGEHPRSTIASPFLLFAIVSLGALLRIGLTLHYVDLADPELWEFGVIAQNLANQGVYSYLNPSVPTALMPPGYVLIIALAYKLFGTGMSANVCVAVILLAFQTAIPVALGWTVSRLWGQRAGVVAVVLALFWPMFLIMAGRLHCVPIYTVLLILACGVLFASKPPSLAKAAWCGAIVGLYANFRFEGCLFLLPFAYYLFRQRGEAVRPLRTRLAAIFSMGACFLLVAGPWMVRNYMVFGKVTSGTMGGFTFLMGHHESASGASNPHWDPNHYDPLAGTRIAGAARPHCRIPTCPEDELLDCQYNYGRAITFAINHPGREVELAVYKAWYFLVGDFTHEIGRTPIVWLPSLVALAAGLYYFCRYNIGCVRQQTLWMIFLVQFALAVVFYAHVRYRMAVDFVPLAFFAAWLSSCRRPKEVGRPYRQDREMGTEDP